MNLKQRVFVLQQGFNQQTGTLNYDFAVWIIPSRETILGLWLSKYREVGFRRVSGSRE